MHPITFNALQLLQIHGISSITSMRQHLAELTGKTMNNLVQMGYALRTTEGYGITSKGRERLRKGLNPEPGQPPQATAAPAAPAMLSNAEIEHRIIDVLRRATRPVLLTDICRRAKLTENLVRPTLTVLVQIGRVETSLSTGKYRLAKSKYITAASAPRHMGGPRTTLDSRDYTCPELQRTPGMPAERFAAFELPSRMGNRLHWPDGRITPFDGHTVASA